MPASAALKIVLLGFLGAKSKGAITGNSGSERPRGDSRGDKRARFNNIDEEDFKLDGARGILGELAEDGACSLIVSVVVVVVALTDDLPSDRLIK